MRKEDGQVVLGYWINGKFVQEARKHEYETIKSVYKNQSPGLNFQQGESDDFEESQSPYKSSSA
ncbi:MAG: hypothetical protein V2I33_20410 [Kangiellaceae bacterium]|jgi:hypothetical protein|nr:hypothetical protein [Kangiellaceae bacterium]